MRVVSLIASSTEIVCALGQSGSLVARSHECDYPEWVKDLPAVTAPKLDPNASSKAIDEQVKALVRDAVSVYKVDGDALRRLEPDVIITQTQCEVCAVSLKDVEAAMSKDFGLKAKVVALEPNKLTDVWKDIRKVALALGIPEQGKELVKDLQTRMKEIAATAAKLPKPRVACIEWLDPLMSAGNWVPELVELAGGTNLFGEAGKHSPSMDWPSLFKADPDVIIAMPCGFDLARTKAEFEQAKASQADWGKLKAVKEGRVYAVDGNQYFNRPGPRLADSLDILAELLHPDTFDFGNRDKAWSNV